MDMTTSPLLLLLFFMHQSSADSNCLWPSGDGRCTDCKRGWHGDSCNYKCSGFCDVGGCHRDTGRCIQCGAGYYATNCTETCPPNCRYSHGDKPHCDRETGSCLENCQGGWWGEKCDNKCSDGCENNSCFGWDGSCARGCRNGWAGDSCDTRCPGGCHGDTCEQYGGHKCTQGCKQGLHGHHCDKQCNRHCRDQDCFYDHRMKSTFCRQGCVDGWMSLDCKLKCPPNCEACSQETGECSRCKQGYWGTDCTKPCSAACFNKTCDRDGRCRSCQLGYHGYNCEIRCVTACVGCLETHEPCRCKDKCDVTCLPITHDSRECPDEDDVNTSGSYRPGHETQLVAATVVVFSLNLQQ